MKIPFLRCTALILAFSYTTGILCAAEPTVTIEPYTKDEFPVWAKDLRRTEIVTLGSLPFVTLGVTMGYSFYRYFSHGMDTAYFPNPMAKSSSAANLNTDEQIGIIATSAAISLLIGLTDLTVQLIRRKNEPGKTDIVSGSVEITPIPAAVPEIVPETAPTVPGADSGARANEENE